jgi:hypothetical protein
MGIGASRTRIQSPFLVSVVTAKRAASTPPVLSHPARASTIMKIHQRRRSSAWLEQGLHNAKVTGSNPVAASLTSDCESVYAYPRMDLGERGSRDMGVDTPASG